MKTVFRLIIYCCFLAAQGTIAAAANGHPVVNISCTDVLGLKAIQAQLYGQYEASQHLNVELTEPVLTMSPEQGSPETRYPGLSKDIFKIFLTTPYFNYRNLSPIDENYILELMNKYAKAADQLDELCGQRKLDSVTCSILTQSAQAIDKMIDEFKKSYDPFRPTSQWLSHLHNYAWNFSTIITQAVVALQFRGTKYQFNIMVSEAYKSLYQKKYSSRRTIRKNDIEIDILIDHEGGQQTWVEVKSSRASLVGKFIELHSTELSPEDELIILREKEFVKIDAKEAKRMTEQMQRQSKMRQELGLSNQVLILAGFRHLKSHEDMSAAFDSQADGIFVLHPDPLPFVDTIRRAVRESMNP